MKQLLSFMVAAAFSLTLNAQLIPLATSPELQGVETQVERNQQIIEEVRKAGGSRNGTQVVPVVFHVIHKGSPVDFNDRITEQPYSANLSHDQITSSLYNLNDRFANTWTNYWDQPDESNAREAVSVNAQIQFELAKRDPNGAPTSGIKRYDINSLDLSTEDKQAFLAEGINIFGYEGAGQDAGCDEIALKEAVGWDPNRYLNIYVVPEIMDNNSSCGVTWHSTFPRENGEQISRDGVIIQANRLGYGAFTSSIRGLNVDLVQAIGQYLMLYPVWFGNASCEDAIAAYNAQLTDPDYCLSNGDRVCDTDPIPWGCNSVCVEDPCDAFNNTPFPEGWTSPTSNYMYPQGSDFCPDHFTQGQIDRMQACLDGPRVSMLDTDVLTEVNVYDVEASLSVERTCYNVYEPIVTVTNTGSNAIPAGTIYVDINGGASNSMTQVVGSVTLQPGQIVNVPFSGLIISNGEDTQITANVRLVGVSEPFTDNNQDMHTVLGDADGFVEIRATYRGISGAPLYSVIDSDDNLVIDSRKVYNNVAASLKEEFTANNYNFAGFLKWGGENAQEWGIAGDIAPNATYWIGNSGPIDGQEYQTAYGRYYLPPGDYKLALGSNRITVNNQMYSIFSTYGCNPGPDGTTCELTLNGLTDLLNQVQNIHTQEGVDPGFPAGTEPNPYEYSSTFQEFPFTIVPENYLDEECCADENGDGICDGTVSADPTFDLEMFQPFNVQPTSAVLEGKISSNGLARTETVTFQIATDLSFIDGYQEVEVPFSPVNEEYFLLKEGFSAEFTGLVEQQTYYGRFVIDDLGIPSVSQTVQFTTPQNACGDETSINYNSRDYDLITIGDQCWFAKNLQTTELNDKTALTDGTLALQWATALSTNTPAKANPNGQSDDALWDSGKGYYYNVSAATHPDLCPAGWRVPSNADWMELDTTLGFVYTATRLFSVEGSGGTDTHGFNGKLTGKRFTTSSQPGVTLSDIMDGTADLSLLEVSDFGASQYSVFWVSDPSVIGTPGPTDPYGWGDGIYASSETFVLNKFFDMVEYSVNNSNFGGYAVRCMKGGSGEGGWPEIVGECTDVYTLIDNPDGPGQLQARNCNYNPAATVVNDTGCKMLDECGVCGGPGIPDGACNCEGEQPDALGICGGPCPEDADGDGICDVIFRETAGDASLCDYEYANTYRGVEYAIGGYGGNCWYLDNLRAEQWNDGTFITSAEAGSQWAQSTNAEVSLVNTRLDLDQNDRINYGYLYNWYAVNDQRGLCPTGWHVSTDKDWQDLERSLGMSENEVVRQSIRGEDAGAGNVLRGGAIEFNAYPAGIITAREGKLRSSGTESYFWTSTPWNTLKLQYNNNAWHRGLMGESTSDGIVRYNHSWGTSGSMGHGMSVRCVKNK